MNTLEIGYVAGLLLLEDVERNKKNTTTSAPRWGSRMKRLSVDCTALRALALTTPPTALESPDAGLTPH